MVNLSISYGDFLISTISIITFSGIFGWLNTFLKYGILKKLYTYISHLLIIIMSLYIFPTSTNYNIIYLLSSVYTISFSFYNIFTEVIQLVLPVITYVFYMYDYGYLYDFIPYITLIIHIILPVMLIKNKKKKLKQLPTCYYAMTIITLSIVTIVCITTYLVYNLNDPIIKLNKLFCPLDQLPMLSMLLCSAIYNLCAGNNKNIVELLYIGLKSMCFISMPHMMSLAILASMFKDINQSSYCLLSKVMYMLLALVDFIFCIFRNFGQLIV